MNPSRPGARAESALILDCDGAELVAIHHTGTVGARVGLVVVVGGPQYRVGSHRQFVLLARACAAAGIPTLRFDYRGLGDSGGAARTFEDVDDDIRVAIDALFAREPALDSIVLWGLCDAASAVLTYGPADPRVRGLVLLNPWVHTEAGEARARLRHYYWERLTNADFWRRVVRLEVDWRDSLASLAGFIRRARGGASRAQGEARPDFLTRMQRALAGWRRPLAIVLSGQDLVAAEFRILAGGAWRDALSRARPIVHEMPAANHTFSTRAWRDEVAAKTIEWVREWSRDV